MYAGKAQDEGPVIPDDRKLLSGLRSASRDRWELTLGFDPIRPVSSPPKQWHLVGVEHCGTIEDLVTCCARLPVSRSTSSVSIPRIWFGLLGHLLLRGLPTATATWYEGRTKQHGGMSIPC